MLDQRQKRGQKWTRNARWIWCGQAAGSFSISSVDFLRIVLLTLVLPPSDISSRSRAQTEFVHVAVAQCLFPPLVSDRVLC